MIHCDACDAPTATQGSLRKNDYGEYICKDCEQNRAESAWARYCEDFHDGGASGWVTLAQQQEQARRLK